MTAGKCSSGESQLQEAERRVPEGRRTPGSAGTPNARSFSFRSRPSRSRRSPSGAAPEGRDPVYPTPLIPSMARAMLLFGNIRVAFWKKADNRSRTVDAQTIPMLCSVPDARDRTRGDQKESRHILIQRGKRPRRGCHVRGGAMGSTGICAAAVGELTNRPVDAMLMRLLTSCRGVGNPSVGRRRTCERPVSHRIEPSFTLILLRTSTTGPSDLRRDPRGTVVVARATDREDSSPPDFRTGSHPPVTEPAPED